MSKLSNAVYEINKLDECADRNQWVNDIHPLVKLLLTVFYIVIVVSFNKYDIYGLLGLIIYPLAMFILAELSFKDCIKRIKLMLPLVCIVGIFNPFFDKLPVGNVGNLIITSGMISMITLMLKGIFSVLASYILIATTRLDKICYALRMIKIPNIIVTQIMLMYRYITVLLIEADRIYQAYMLRAPGQKGIHFKAWGSLVGQLLLRSMDRSNEVYESMCIRGYDGEFHYNKEKITFPDVGFLMFWMCAIVILKIIPVFWYAGYFLSRF